MGLFYRWRQPAPANWVAGKATIRESRPHGEQWSRESGDSVFDWELNHFGFRTHGFVLDVVAPVHGSYEMSGEFKVPRRAENVGWLAPSVGIGLKPGLELPVHVDPRDREALRIDWPAFLDSPDRKRKQKAADEADHLRRVAELGEQKARKEMEAMEEAEG
jgi:hypothetical protein